MPDLNPFIAAQIVKQRPERPVQTIGEYFAALPGVAALLALPVSRLPSHWQQQPVSTEAAIRTLVRLAYGQGQQL